MRSFYLTTPYFLQVPLHSEHFPTLEWQFEHYIITPVKYLLVTPSTPHGWHVPDP